MRVFALILSATLELSRLRKLVPAYRRDRMSEPQTVYSDLASGATVKGRLFEGIKFFVAQRCPSRQTLIEQIRSNGGEAVPLEKNADHVIADHLRKDAPPGSISYEFVDKSLRNGRLEDPADHPVGPQLGSVRGVGSSQSKRVGRVPFTEDDNRQLCQWVSRCHSEGGYVRGNELYKQLQIAVSEDLRYLFTLRFKLTVEEPTAHMAIVASPLHQAIGRQAS